MRYFATIIQLRSKIIKKCRMPFRLHSVYIVLVRTNINWLQPTILFALIQEFISLIITPITTIIKAYLLI